MSNDKNICRVQKDKNNPYVMINKGFLENRNLSWKAKGLLAYFLSKPDDWKVILEHVYKQSPDGEKAVRSGFNELKKENYLMKYPVYNSTGIDHYETLIFETQFADDEKIKNKKIMPDGSVETVLSQNRQTPVESVVACFVNPLNVHPQNEGLLSNEYTNTNYTEGVIATPVLEEISTKIINPSVSLSNEETTDRKTDELKDIEDLKTIQAVLDDEYLQDPNIVSAIFLKSLHGYIRDLFFIEKLKVGNSTIPQALVRETLKELTPYCIEHTYKKIDEYSREKGIRSPKSYTMVVLYNSVSDESISMLTEVNYKVHGSGRVNP